MISSGLAAAARPPFILRGRVLTPLAAGGTRFAPVDGAGGLGSRPRPARSGELDAPGELDGPGEPPTEVAG